MGFRIVKINSRSKLETQLGYLVCRNDSETRVLLDEISVIIVENQQVCLTTALLSELMSHHVRIVFCDSKHNPQGEISPYASCYDTYAKIKKQLAWTDDCKSRLWSLIVRQKIKNQAFVLRRYHQAEAAELLDGYSNDIQPGDGTNREGLAAKAYFAALFGKGFDRRKDSDIRNVYLNYGYSLLLSGINREIAAFGYLNPIGIHHIGEQNPFNLGCDFVEVFRPFVDDLVMTGNLSKDNYKKELMLLMTREVQVGDKTVILENAFRNYVLCLLSILNTGDYPIYTTVTFIV